MHDRFYILHSASDILDSASDILDSASDRMSHAEYIQHVANSNIYHVSSFFHRYISQALRRIQYRIYTPCEQNEKVRDLLLAFC